MKLKGVILKRDYNNPFLKFGVTIDLESYQRPYLIS